MKHQLSRISNRKTGHLRQLLSVRNREMTQLDQDDCHLFRYSLVHTLVQDLHATLSKTFDKSKKTPRTSNKRLASNTVKIL